MARPPKVKPPHIQWPPLATLGSSAFAGSYFGHQFPTSPTVTMVVAAGVLSTGLCSTRAFIKITTLSIAVFFVFLSISGAEQKKPNWVTILQNEVCELDLVIDTEPTTTPRTLGAMSVFDYREDSTWCAASANPPGQTKNSLQINVCFTRKTDIKKSKHTTRVGWLRVSNNKLNKPVFYIVGNQKRTKNKSEQDTKQKPTQNTVQQKIKETLVYNLGAQEKTLAMALFFGLRENGWEELSNTYKRAGMSHILAISGMHVGLMLFFVTTMFTTTKSKPWWTALVLLVGVAIIILTVEPRAPVLRSIAVVLLLITLRCINIRCKGVGVLGTVAIVFLFYDPTNAVNTSFQLTFIVVASLCVLSPQIYWRILGPNNPNDPIVTLFLRGAGSLWLTGACAWGTSTPIVSRVFGVFTPAGLLSGVPSVVLLSLTIVIGIVKISCGIFWTGMARLFSFVFAISLQTINETAVFFANTTHSSFLNQVNLGWAESLSLLAWLTFWSLLRKKRSWLWITLPMLVFCVLSTPTQNGSTTITTVNVGHGTCHIIQNGNHTTMIDAGSRNNLDIGKTKLAHTLRKLRVHTINTLIITHADLDHLAGLVDVFNSTTIQKLIIAPQALENKTKPLHLIMELARKKQTSVVAGVSGWTELVQNMKFSILSPQKTDTFHSSNESSIVLLLNTNGRTLLFTGDINEAKIIQLTNRDMGQIDVIELPHHGQWSRESQVFINKQHPFAVIQSTNTSRHTKDRWKIPISTTRFVTAIDGDITISINKEGRLSIFGSNDPATMPPCVLPKY